MSHKIIKIDSYSPQKDDCFFFDTNIWLNLYTPVPGRVNKSFQQKISSFFGQVLRTKSTIYTSSLVISEFFNTYCRIIFKMRQEDNPDKFKDFKKDFRSTEEYENLVAELVNIINSEILALATKTDDCFSKISSKKLMEIGTSYDFNDKYICELCSLNKFKIVTADKDYALAAPKTDLILVS